MKDDEQMAAVRRDIAAAAALQTSTAVPVEALDASAKARESRLEAAAEAESFRSEEAAVRASLHDDPTVSNEDFGRLVEEAADADERRAWQAEVDLANADAAEREQDRFWRHGEPTTESGGHTARRIIVVIPFDVDGDDESATDFIRDGLSRADINVLSVEIDPGPAMA